MTALTDGDKSLIKTALRTLINVHIGLPAAAMAPVTHSGIRHDGRTFTVDETLEAHRLIVLLRSLLTGLPETGGLGINHPSVSEEARRAQSLMSQLEFADDDRDEVSLSRVSIRLRDALIEFDSAETPGQKAQARRWFYREVG